MISDIEVIASFNHLFKPSTLHVDIATHKDINTSNWVTRFGWKFGAIDAIVFQKQNFKSDRLMLELIYKNK